MLIPEGRLSRPWEDEPPPAPPGASREERLRVLAAWEAWSPFRPDYSRDGEVVRVEIDLKRKCLARRFKRCHQRARGGMAWVSHQSV